MYDQGIGAMTGYVPSAGYLSPFSTLHAANRNPSGTVIGNYRHEVPREAIDWHRLKREHPRAQVRTLVRGGHLIRIAVFGKRQDGKHRKTAVISVLHPKTERNPRCRLKNPASIWAALQGG